MSAFPRIPSPFGAVIVPAVEEQQYPDLFFTQLLFVAVPGCDQIQIRTRPYNYDTGTLKPESEETITNEPGLWQLAADYPLVATVMGGVIGACTLVLYLRKAQAALALLQAILEAAVAAESNATVAVAEAQAALDAALEAQSALPEDATDEEKQAAADIVANTTAQRDAANATLLTKQTAVIADTGSRDAQAAVVAGLEAQLGK